MHFETEILHSVPVDVLTGAISTPIYQTATYVQEAPGVNKGYDYARSNNPTRATLENLLAELEHGSYGFAFASGLAAVDAVIKLLSAGDEVLAVDDIYGGTYRIFTHIYSKFGVKVNYVDTTDVQNIVDNITEKTKFIWIESPTNPTLKISDIEQIAKIAKANNCLLVVDNTFASPAIQRPLELGADIVFHSATKYLAGHSDLIGGAVIVNDVELAEKIKFIQNSSGGILGPFDSWLTIRGIYTLPLRVEKQSNNALQIARYLESRPEVDKVYYPGLPSHKNHDIIAKTWKLFGGVVTFSLKDDTIEAAEKFVTSTGLFKLAESLGGTKSLICHPCQMTHKSVPSEKRRAAGIQDSLIRLSVGIEHSDDLINDLEAAFKNLVEGVFKNKFLKEEVVQEVGQNE
ncbi:MAG TPA: PLP-dependent aspartate aminotransferase family protein [Patescibacteria group bacterium]|nr:PLP-dependent aspartate aminotransferase family protein [Patescibacteria group bacterium]